MLMPVCNEGASQSVRLQTGDSSMATPGDLGDSRCQLQFGLVTCTK
jgi:hypothetical protein